MTDNDSSNLTRWIIGAPIGVLLVVGLLILALPWFLSIVGWSYDTTSREFQKAAEDSIPYIYIGVLGIMVTALGIAFSLVATIATVLVSLKKAKQERKQQDTQKILLDTRLSSFYQEKVVLRWNKFGTGADGNSTKARANLSIYNRNTGSAASVAVRYLLNYYEFLAIGIHQGHLEEDVLRESLRGILCRLVFDMRLIIRAARIQPGHEQSFEYIVALYGKWKKEDNADEWNMRVDLGPETKIKFDADNQ